MEINISIYTYMLQERILNIYSLISLQSYETFLYGIWYVTMQLAFHSHQVGQSSFRQLRLCCAEYSRSHCNLDKLEIPAHWSNHSSYFVLMVVGDDMFTHVSTLEHTVGSTCA